MKRFLFTMELITVLLADITIYIPEIQKCDSDLGYTVNETVKGNCYKNCAEVVCLDNTYLLL